MHATYIFNLKQPCKNRGISFQDNKDGSVTINGKHLETMRECDEYLEGIKRID